MPHCREQGGHSAQYTLPDLAGKDGMHVGLSCFAVGRSKLLVNESGSGCLRWCLDRCQLCAALMVKYTVLEILIHLIGCCDLE